MSACVKSDVIGRTVPGESSKPGDQSNLWISDLINMCKIGQERARKLKMRILGERLTVHEDDLKVHKWNSDQIPGFPKIYGCPKQTVPELFLRDYDRFSQAAIFLTEIEQNDEDYAGDIKEIRWTVDCCLVYLRNALGESVHPKMDAVDGGMNTPKSSTPVPDRHTRHYIILHLVESLKKSVKTDYENLLSKIVE